MIASMRSLTSQDFRLQANSIQEVQDGLERLALHYARDFRFQGRKLRKGPLLNAIALHFLSLPDDARRKILGATIPELERLLETDGDVPAFLDAIMGRKINGAENPPAYDVARKAEVPVARPKRSRRSG